MASIRCCVWADAAETPARTAIERTICLSRESLTALPRPAKRCTVWKSTTPRRPEKRACWESLSRRCKDRGRALLGTACLVSDLTEMSNMAQQVRLQDNMASLGEMSAGIAHEFKNSLATISGYSQMLASDPNQETREFAQKIAAETGNLTRIVTDFLNFARPRGMQREPLDLRAMLEDCARENGVALTMENFPSPCTVEADPTALRQVFANLMRNSKEAEVAGKAMAITAQAEDKGNQIFVRLSDNGTGIPADKLPKIFIPFFTTKAEGTGLGLALVHRIVTDHGGAVSVTSNTAGTTFMISLPRTGAASAESSS